MILAVGLIEGSGKVVPSQVNVAVSSDTLIPVRPSPSPQLVTVTDSWIVGSAQLDALVHVLVTQILGATTVMVLVPVAVAVSSVAESVKSALANCEVCQPTLPLQLPVPRPVQQAAGVGPWAVPEAMQSALAIEESNVGNKFRSE